MKASEFLQAEPGLSPTGELCYVANVEETKQLNSSVVLSLKRKRQIEVYLSLIKKKLDPIWTPYLFGEKVNSG